MEQNDFIRSYFNAERAESLLFMGVGALAFLAALYFWFFLKRPFYTGMAWPMALVALIQLSVGASVFFRSPKDIARVEQFVKNEPTQIRTAEMPRMEGVMKNFVLYRYTELALVVVGLALIFLHREPNFWKGVGAGLSLQAGLMLLLDFFAEKRGAEYLKRLAEIS